MLAAIKRASSDLAVLLALLVEAGRSEPPATAEQAPASPIAAPASAAIVPPNSTIAAPAVSTPPTATMTAPMKPNSTISSPTSTSAADATVTSRRGRPRAGPRPARRMSDNDPGPRRPRKILRTPIASANARSTSLGNPSSSYAAVAGDPPGMNDGDRIPSSADPEARNFRSRSARARSPRPRRCGDPDRRRGDSRSRPRRERAPSTGR